MPETKVKVTDGDETIEVEVIADAIITISKAMERLRKGRLKDSALVLLIQHAAPYLQGANGGSRKLNKAEVEAVLTGIEGLKKEYVKS